MTLVSIPYLKIPLQFGMLFLFRKLILSETHGYNGNSFTYKMLWQIKVVY